MALKRRVLDCLGRQADLLPHNEIDGLQSSSGWEIIAGSNCWLQFAEGELAPGSEPFRFGRRLGYEKHELPSALVE